MQNTCALGIAVNTYLDAMVVEETQPVEESKSQVKQRIQKDIFIYAEDYAADIDKAFQLWDAVYAGVKASGNQIKDRKSFEEANDWLSFIR
jgi:hypothetical protein